MSEFNWTPVEEIEARVNQRLSRQAEIEKEVEKHNAQVEEEYAKQRRKGLENLSDLAGGVSPIIGEAMVGNRGKPYSTIGTSSNGGRWQTEQTYFTINWKCPPLDQIKAYDLYVSIYGYNQAGRRVVLMKNINGERANNFMTRKNFTYLRLSAAHINGNLGIYKGAIEAAFNKGIRFWDPKFAGSLGSFPTDVIKTNTKR